MTTSTPGCIARLAASLALAACTQTVAPTPLIDASVADAPNTDATRVFAPGADVTYGSADAPAIVSLGGDPNPPNTPRPIAPTSMGRVTSRRPTLRWHGWSQETVIELSRDRALSTVAMTLRSRERTMRVPLPLAPGVWFWRVRHEEQNEEWNSVGPVWYFVVPSRDREVDTSWRPPSRGCDVNGDGRSDYVRDDLDLGESGSGDLYALDHFLGGPSGLGPLRRVTVPRFDQPACVGDLDGDGRGDLALHCRYYNLGNAVLMRGGVDGVNPATMTVIDSPSVPVGAGDVNGDGYGDLIMDGFLLPGGPAGPTAFVGPRLPWGEVYALGDVDGDGYADVASHHGDRLQMFRGGPEGFSEVPAVTAVVDVIADFFVGHDVTGDGLADVVIVQRDRNLDDGGEHDLFAQLLTGPHLQSSTRLTFSLVDSVAHENVATVALSDDDGDGDADLLLLTSPHEWHARTRELIVVDGGPTFGATRRRVTLTYPQHELESWLRGLGDVDGDGRDDFGLTFVCGRPSWVEVFRGGSGGARRAPIRGVRWDCGSRYE